MVLVVFSPILNKTLVNEISSRVILPHSLLCYLLPASIHISIYSLSSNVFIV
jgi:hypothetical protein